MSERYKKSEQLLERALKSIPLGSQTFSKSRTQYPFGVSPYFIERGQGANVWDADGNQYTDYVMSLAAVTLGYNDPDVTTAVATQLGNGVIYSLPHRLEMEVAEMIIERVPCAEAVRFGKNGSDATSGAIRIARAYTGRDRVAVCGYHGWQDWYIGSTARNRGVPKAVSGLTHTFAYNDISSLEKLFADYPQQFAAVILEPMNVTPPTSGYLQALKECVHRHGALLIFDETITGFRYEVGGAQQRFGVTPDLASFGKGLANGYPVSAVCGRADVMKLMEEIFFSFTFGGELLSLAAAKACLHKLTQIDVIGHIKKLGEKLMAGLNTQISKYGLEDLMSVGGDPTWSFLLLRDTPKYTSWEIKTLYLQEMFARGILTLGTHNLSFAHSESDIDHLLQSYTEVFAVLKQAVREEKLYELLHCKPLEPLFKVR